MTKAFSSYVICGTPRSGSTLLCEMLSATGLAGRPNSYLRREDVAEWAEAWGVPRARDVGGPGFDRDYLAAMLREGRAGTGVFGLRLMWASMREASERLSRALGTTGGTTGNAAAPFEEAFGPTLCVHLSRTDKVAQAVSLLRAEQSQVWHLGTDGRVLEGVETARPIFYDGARLSKLLDELRSDDEAWDAFFEKRAISPSRLTYETMAADPRTALGRVLSALGLDPEVARTTPIRTARMADAHSEAWVERFRNERRA